jgi:hypothetical protein
MKATESDVSIGIALEDYDGTYAYTEGYINQFGDDLVKTIVVPPNQNMDARTQDGCSYGGGVEQGATACVKERVGDVAVQATAVDTLTPAIAQFKNQPAQKRSTPAGNEVRIGQALMFINLQHFTITLERDALAQLVATSTILNGNGTETVWSRIKTLAQNFVDGVLHIAGIQTDTLCVGNVCVDEATFLKMVEKAGETGSAAGNNSDTTTITPPVSDTEETPPPPEPGASTPIESTPEPEIPVDPPPPEEPIIVPTTPEPEVPTDPAPIIETTP